MDILHTGLQILLAVTSIPLIMLILMHKGQGGGMSEMFGGGMASGLKSSGVAQRNLNRFTVVLGVVWALTIVALGLLMKFNG